MSFISANKSEVKLLEEIINMSFKPFEHSKTYAYAVNCLVTIKTNRFMSERKSTRKGGNYSDVCHLRPPDVIAFPIQRLLGLQI